MAICKRGQPLMTFLLLASVLQLTSSQETCVIQVDLARGLWRDLTPWLVVHHQYTLYCAGYWYHRANLDCSPQPCPSGVVVNSPCTVYFNTNNQVLAWQCLTACTNPCYSYPCHEDVGFCPCEPLPEKYRGMCVPNDCLRSCLDGYCDGKGKCFCYPGFKKDPNNDIKCEPILCLNADRTSNCKSECVDKCKHGLCSSDGACYCNNGYETQPPGNFFCHKTCPSVTLEDSYCESLCTGSCVNGTCDHKGACTCRDGFNKASPGAYQCDEITCPSEREDNLKYCASQCNQHCQNGTCTQGGACECKYGFKKEDDTLYKCNAVTPPSPTRDEHVHCERSCDTLGKNGTRVNIGNYTCGKMTKEAIDAIYQCNVFSCPSVTVESWSNETYFDKMNCTCVSRFQQSLNCSSVICPWSTDADSVYCMCNMTCPSGECSSEELCDCIESFVSTDPAVNVSCQHDSQGGVSKVLLLSAIGGGLGVIVVIIIVIALVLKMRSRKEQNAVPEVPLKEFAAQVEYANHGLEQDGNGSPTEEMEENILYQSFDFRPAVHRV